MQRGTRAPGPTPSPGTPLPRKAVKRTRKGVEGLGMGRGMGGGGEECRPRVVSREPLGPAGFRWLSVARLKVLLPPPPDRARGGCSGSKGATTVCSPEPRHRERSLTTVPVRGCQGKAAGLGIRGSAEPERRGGRGRSPRSDPVRPQGDEDGDHRAVPPADRCGGARGRHTLTRPSSSPPGA